MKSALKWPKQINSRIVEKLIRAEKDVKKATELFDSATAEYSNGFRHDSSTFHAMITKLVITNEFHMAEQMLDRMKRENCKITEDIILTICRGYSRVHKPLESVRLFNKMAVFDCQPSEKSYISIFAILVEENHLIAAMGFYKFMRETGISPSVVSLNILIKALCKSAETIERAIGIFHEMPNRGLHPDSITYGTLINGLCKAGNLRAAQELFNEMNARGCLPSVVTYTSLINAYCKMKSIDKALVLMDEMKREGIPPNVITYTSIIDGLCKEGKSLKAMEMLETMREKRVKANFITYSSLIDGLSRERRVYEAVEVFDRMKLQGIKADGGLYGKIISGFCDEGKFGEAANFIDEMAVEGIPCNRVTWKLHVGSSNRVVKGLCLNGNVNRAFQIYLSMRTRGVLVEDHTCGALVRCFCQKGDLEKAARVVNEVSANGGSVESAEWEVLVNRVIGNTMGNMLNDSIDALICGSTTHFKGF